MVLTLHLKVCTLDGKLIYVKTGVRYKGNFSDIQPITEALASDIIKLFEVDCVQYYIAKLIRNNYEYTVCYSYDFASDGVFHNMKKIIGTPSGDLYEHMSTKFNIKRELNEMIVIDFLLNNIDRHTRNFGFIWAYEICTAI